MNTKAKGIRGFTLVELIVVIAIIAILAAVSVIGFTRYIENARISNDEQAASSMTRVVQYYLTDKPGIELDALDVRSLIEDNNGGSFNFTPQSSGYAFVYVAESQEVVLVNVNEAIETGVQLEQSSDTRLLSDIIDLNQESEGIGNTPEEIFGADTFLLSKGGSTVAEIVHRIRDLAESDQLDHDFASLVSYSGSKASTQTEQTFFDSLLNEFDPEYNLFVNNNTWSHIPYEVNYYSSEFRRIIFQDNIKNLPTMTTASTAFIHIDSDVSLPRTIKTIEANALSKLYLKTGTSINTSKLENAIAEADAFSSAQKTAYNISLTEVEQFVELAVTAQWYKTDTSEWLDFVEGTQELSSSTRVKFDITNVPRHLIDDIIILRVTRASGTSYLIKAYNDDSGLIGSKTIPVEYIEVV
jgi:prepilin-type N-terminal cleavage/methylation domain-containing protein